jgi:hypothetical protein
MQLRPDRTMKKKTTKKAAGFSREVTGPAAYVATRCAIAEMGTREMKEVMRAHQVPIPKLRGEMIDRLARHFGATGAKITVRIG